MTLTHSETKAMTKMLTDLSNQKKNPAITINQNDALLLQWLLDDWLKANNINPNSTEAQHYAKAALELMAKIIEFPPG